MKFNRRALLNATGLGAGSLFLPSLLGDKKAHALGEAKRVVFFVTQHGPGYENWHMRQGNNPDKLADWEFDLNNKPKTEWSPVLEPLYDHRADINVLDGLALTSAIMDQATNNHNMGTSHLLTGAKIVRNAGFNKDGNGGGRSVDQLIADHVKVAGRTHSLHYSTRYAPWPFSFQGPNNPTPHEADPSKAFDRIFGGALPTPGTSDPTEEQKILAARPSVLDLVGNQYTELSKRIGSEDKKRLDNHLQLIRDLEVQLRAAGTISPEMAKCTKPTRPSGSGNVPAKTRAFMGVAAAALACDISRVAAIVADQLSAGDFGASGDVHQDIAHAASAGKPASKLMANYYRVHSAEFAHIIGLFKSAGILQNSILVWLNELSNGPHDLFRIMAVTAGQGGGTFRTGRYIKYAETNHNPSLGVSGSGGCATKLGPGHSKLHVSIMRAMGMDVNQIPTPQAFTTTSACVAEIGNRSGMADVTGPLPRLA